MPLNCMDVYHVFHTDSTFWFSTRNCHQELPRFLASENFSLLLEPNLISIYGPLITSSHVCFPQSWGLTDGAQTQIDLKRERKGLEEATSCVVSFGGGCAELRFHICHLSALFSVGLLNFSLFISKMGTVINPTLKSCLEVTFASRLTDHAE